MFCLLAAGQAKVGNSGGSSSSGGGKSVPRHAVLLRWGGMLSVLDLSRGAELMLADEVRVQQTSPSPAPPCPSKDNALLLVYGLVSNLLSYPCQQVLTDMLCRLC